MSNTATRTDRTRTPARRARDLDRRTARAVKYGAPRVTRAGRAR
jgi:hypothetical protein